MVLLCAVGAFWAFRGESIPEGDGPGEPSKVKVRPGKGNTPKVRRSATRITKNGSRDVEDVKGTKKVKKEKPTFALDDDDESNLTEAQRKIIEAIRAALEDNNREEVLKLVQKLQKSQEWPDGIPKSIKMAAIEALGWFGVSCLPELAGFLADTTLEHRLMSKHTCIAFIPHVYGNIRKQYCKFVHKITDTRQVVTVFPVCLFGQTNNETFYRLLLQIIP